ncbi:MAG: DUF2007 domain-containing protein [Phycisphaerae bacterium]|nr:DUF2007 domain-containing protein [Phycisphaerae bacterium]
MARDTKPNEHGQEASDAELTPMVPAMFAASRSEAERCCQILKEQGIPASVGDDDYAGPAGSVGVPVMVPDQRLESASEILSLCAGETDSDSSEYAASAKMGRDDEEEEDEDFGDDYDDDDDEEEYDDEEDDLDDEDEFEDDDEM